MKGFLAIVLAMVPEFLARPLKMPIHLALSYDEEVGCIGVRRLIEALDHMPVRPALCIVGEPTDMKPVIGHKGKTAMRCRVHGLECHSSLAPSGVNAVEYAAELIVFLRAMAEARRRGGPHDETFDPPFTTIHTGIVQGGTALNIVPRDCSFEFEFRHLPGDDPVALLAEVTGYANNTLLPAMREISAEAAIEFEQITSFPGLRIADDDPVTELVKALSGSNDTAKVSFGTEGGLFQAAGVPTVVCGPGSIEQAHKPDEFLSIDQIVRCEAFLRRLIERVSAS
jgi:acetylornithine deacetylase